LIDEAAKALVAGEGSEFLATYLEKIREIKDGLQEKDESYEEFLKLYASNYDFNLNAQSISTKEVLQLESQKAKKPS